MYGILLIIFLVIAIALIILIMLQQSKGDSVSGFFGVRPFGMLFGSSGFGNFMTRLIVILATLFFIVSLSLGCF